MNSPWSIIVAFCMLTIAGHYIAEALYAWFYAHKLSPWSFAPLFAVAMLLCAYALTQIPAPVSIRQEEPTPWPTETPASGWQDFYDALVVTDTQLDYRLAAVETCVCSAPTATPYPTVMPTATPTAAPTVPELCTTCIKGTPSLGGMTCQNCYAAGYRWVHSASPNSDCQSCIGVSVAAPVLCSPCSGPDSPCAPGQSCEDCCYGMSWTCVQSLADCNLCRQARMGAAALPEPPLWTGVATWYGMDYAGKLMTNEQPYNPFVMTAALDIALCREYMGRTLRVCAGKCIEVEVTDCGYLAENPTALGPSILDMSMASFQELATLDTGVVMVNVWLR